MNVSQLELNVVDVDW